MGMTGPGPIAVSEVLAYCQLFQIRGQYDRLRLLTLIQQMDQVFLKFVSESRPTTPGK